MARTIGSDDLYRLIHSLTTEEKGYFKKFAKRHSAEGNIHLDMFDAIARQEEFEEASLKRKFKGYAVKKVYLKEMITDSLVLYYRSKHSHIELFQRIEKIHVLLYKGFYIEAGKELDKALEISVRMQLFTIERYLLRMRKQMSVHALPVKAEGFSYKDEADRNLKQEINVTEWELRISDWFQKSVKYKDNFGLVSEADMEKMAAVPVYSDTARMSQLIVLMYMALLNGNDVKCYETSKELIQLTTKIKKESDSSTTTVFAMNNHIRNCLPLAKFDEAAATIDKLIKDNQEQSYQADMARARAYLAKLFTCLGSGTFEEGVQFVREIEKDMLAINKRHVDVGRTLTFQIMKSTMLLFSRNYQECWIVLQQMKFQPTSPILKHHYAKWVENCLMVQVGMKNFDIANKLARKELKAFTKLQMRTKCYDMLFDFFKRVNALNYKTLAKEYSEAYMKYAQEETTDGQTAEESRIFSHWMDDISGGKTIRQHLEDRLKEHRRKAKLGNK